MDAEDIILLIFVILILAGPISTICGFIYYIKIYGKLKLYKEGKYRQLANMILIGFVTMMIISGLAVCMTPMFSCSRSKAREVSCMSNLRQIGLALKMYSLDYNGFYPPISGAAGLEMLRSGGYLENTRLYICPNSERSPAREGECLSESTVDYIYIGGYSLSDTKKTAIVYDKDLNHKKYGNILYSDGHETGFRGMNWKECLFNPSVLKEEHQF
ncbi:MAG: DUF1559 domain-containing protein [Victivallales bacterium]